MHRFGRHRAFFLGILLVLVLSVRGARAEDDGRSQSDFDRKLRFAAESGQLKYASEALRQGAAIDHTDEWGMTPLMLAALRGHYKMVRLLLGAGADPNRTTDRDLTALHFAAKNCAHPVVADLILAGAKVNSKSSHEQTALMAAAEQGCHRVVAELVKVKGIDLKSVDLSGRDALDYAKENEVTGFDSESYEMILGKRSPPQTSRATRASPKAKPPGRPRNKPEKKPALLGLVAQ